MQIVILEKIILSMSTSVCRAHHCIILFGINTSKVNLDFIDSSCTPAKEKFVVSFMDFPSEASMPVAAESTHRDRVVLGGCINIKKK